MELYDSIIFPFETVNIGSFFKFFHYGVCYEYGYQLSNSMFMNIARIITTKVSV